MLTSMNWYNSLRFFEYNSVRVFHVPMRATCHRSSHSLLFGILIMVNEKYKLQITVSVRNTAWTVRSWVRYLLGAVAVHQLLAVFVFLHPGSGIVIGPMCRSKSSTQCAQVTKKIVALQFSSRFGFWWHETGRHVYKFWRYWLRTVVEFEVSWQHVYKFWRSWLRTFVEFEVSWQHVYKFWRYWLRTVVEFEVSWQHVYKFWRSWLRTVIEFEVCSVKTRYFRFLKHLQLLRFS
jgi:hypothetical protein